MALQRLDLTLQSFLWSNKAQGQESSIIATIRPLVAQLHALPFVVTEEYEKVFPFDIYPVQLIKSILVDDIEMMEELGIYEVAPEDFALCETICTSKIPSQTIVRDGLAMLRKEMS